MYLKISQEELLRYYQGTVTEVLAHDVNGVKIQFPISILRPYILHGGISGYFEIRFDRSNKFIDIKRVV